MFKKTKQPLKIKNRTEIINDKSPFSFVESYKTLRSGLSFMGFQDDVKTIMITSSIPDEGKSTVAINLAKVLVDAGKKVLLIDADLRKPALREYLRVKKTGNHGLSAVLAGKVQAENAIYLHTTYQFDVMLAGIIPPNPSELLGGANLAPMLETLKKTYDYIIIDTPPVNVVTDASVIAPHIDGTLLVVRQNFAERDVVLAAKRKLEQTHATLLGSVMNYYDDSKVKSGATPYSYSYEYGE
ncbi:CpsD/CapB family tyrosine-protein kinase [Erysipelothrix aquatica]|uniref:CpsD/CapB family tyrosine-protein kinase n=1 Tax=Erysipelothrix aquatica TaxID=2683714 RepID=UPI00135C73F0|nr:CpsD/CapB family tyrosine-protein kinase [Erysipelothrix aquatica]